MPENNLRERIETALRASRADYTEIRLEKRQSTQVALRGRRLETADVTLHRGGIVRCLARTGGWGIATFNDLTNLPHRVQQAYQGACLIQSEPIELAPIPISQDTITVSLARDFRGVSLEEKKTLIQEYNDILLRFDPRIVDTYAAYTDTFSHVTFANSEGTYLQEERPMVSILLSAVARQNGNVQQGFDAIASTAGLEAVIGRHALAETIAQRALDLLIAPRLKGGRYTIVCNPQLAGLLAHEAFGHLSEADFIYANPQARKMMVLRRRFGPKNLTIVDDGAIPGLAGSHKYDDEGAPTGRTALIQNGVLVGRLHSRQTAAKMGERPTGNARATDYRYPPIVRMTNTFIAAGETPFEEMIRDVDLGIYACDTFGGQTALENFSFSAAHAYMIRNGQIAEMVRNVILSGNLFTTLANIDAIGNDFQWARWGMCSKGQGGLSVGMGAPHIRIRDIPVGGE